ncbi:MAG: CDP-alcohol phosphatidyltransferase family protein [Euryarchaeota archaeon]|nr:CDP-alcohol phosphatidyltransferase family protein [Euryarchaeota archaeon]
MAREYPLDRSAGWQRWPTPLLGIGLLVVAAVWLLQARLALGLSTAFLAGVAGGLVTVSVPVGWAVSRADEPITFATAVTLSRGAALAVFAGFLATGLPAGRVAWLPAVLFAIAAGLDTLDGAIARATDAISELGGRLDTEMDGLTVLFGTALIVAADLVPRVFLLVGLARYLFVFGCWLRRRRGRPVYDLPPSQLRRVLGGLAMATVWMALLPVTEPSVTRPVAVVVLVPFCFNFSRDWLAVSGRR